MVKVGDWWDWLKFASSEFGFSGVETSVSITSYLTTWCLS